MALLQRRGGTVSSQGAVPGGLRGQVKGTGTNELLACVVWQGAAKLASWLNIRCRSSGSVLE